MLNLCFGSRGVGGVRLGGLGRAVIGYGRA